MINLNIIAQFEYNDKTYVYYINNNKIEFGYKDNNLINNKLSENEINLMKEILPKITISDNKDNHLILGSTFYNDKEFQMLLDKESGLKFFYELKGNKLVLPNIDDAKNLFYRFNNVEICDIEKNDFKKITSNFKRHVVLTTSISTIVVTVFSPVITRGIDKLSNHGYSAPGYINIDNYSYNKISALISANVNLSIDEKNFFLSNSGIFEENKKYIDMNYLESVLSDLTIIYAGDDRKQYNAENYILGKFHPDSKSIIIFDSSNFENCNKDVLAHEFCHALTPQFLSLGSGLMEAVNETIQNEYYDTYAEDSQGYQIPCIALKMLCEIVGPETFRKYHFSGNINTIIDSIKEVIGSKKEAVELISCIDNIVIYNREQADLFINKDKEKSYDKKLKESKKNILNNDKRTYELIRKCFENKYDYSMEEDETMMIYADQMGFIDKSRKLFGTNVESVYFKGYFSKKYIIKHPKTFYKLWEPIISKNIDVSIEEALEIGAASVFYIDGRPIYTYEDGLTVEGNRVRGVFSFNEKKVIEEDSRRNKISRNR